MSRWCEVGSEPGLASGCVTVRLTGQGVVGDALVRLDCSHLVAALQAKVDTNGYRPRSVSTHTQGQAKVSIPPLACLRPALICESRPHNHQDHAPHPTRAPRKDGGGQGTSTREWCACHCNSHTPHTHNSQLFSRCDHHSISDPHKQHSTCHGTGCSHASICPAHTTESS